MRRKWKRPPGRGIRGGRGVSQHRREHAKNLAHTGGSRSARLDRALAWREQKAPGVTPRSASPCSGIRMKESCRATTVGMTAPHNLRDMWALPSAPFRGAHFATFARALCERPIKAETSEHGVCPDRGAPWERVVRSTAQGLDGSRHGERAVAVSTATGGTAKFTLGLSNWALTGKCVSQGWRPTCACYDARHCAARHEPRNARKCRQRAAWPGRWTRVRARLGGADWPTVPATVLDSFVGTGTVGLVAERLGRDSILIEINPDYAGMARKRIAHDSPPGAQSKIAA